MPEVLHIIIKKDYAASLIEHLQKEQAIEIVAEDIADIPEWQKGAGRKTLVEVQQHPEQLQPWDIAKYKLPDDPMKLDIQASGVEYTPELKAEMDNQYASYKNGKTKMISSTESKKRIGKILKTRKVK